MNPASIKPADGADRALDVLRFERDSLMVKFHATVSKESVYMRYFHFIQYSQRIAHERLTRLCFLDYDREMALVVEHKDPTTGESVIFAQA